MHIEAIHAPRVLINTGTEIIEAHIKDFNGSPRVNVWVKALEGGRYDIVGNNVDESCLNGICDLKIPQGK